MNMVDDCLISEKPAPCTADHKSLYLQMLRHLERLHRLLLDVIRDEFERRETWDINAVQALLIYNIGDQKLTAGELRGRGFYLGSNVTYNLKKMVAGGFIEQKPSLKDRRSVYIVLTKKGKAVHQRIDELYDRQLSSLSAVGGLDAGALASLNEKMQLLEGFWHHQLRFKM